PQHVSIRFRLHQARKPVTRSASNARALLRRFLIQHYAKRRMKWMQTGMLEVLGELLQSWLMAHGRMRIWALRWRFGLVFAALPVDVILMLGLVVVRFEVFVRDRPGRRDAAVMPHFAEVFFT